MCEIRSRASYETTSLQLAPNAKSILDRARISVPDSYEDKWLPYNIAPGCEADGWELCHTAVSENGGFVPKEDEYEQFGWCWPALSLIHI